MSYQEQQYANRYNASKTGDYPYQNMSMDDSSTFVKPQHDGLSQSSSVYTHSTGTAIPPPPPYLYPQSVSHPKRNRGYLIAITILVLMVLYASKMIMRPERETEEHRDPCLGQTDSRYAEGPQRESGPAPENAAPNRRAEAQKYSCDDYASRPVARHARAIQCDWRQDHKQAYTPRISAPVTR
jgi:hypothetical protein